MSGVTVFVAALVATAWIFSLIQRGPLHGRVYGHPYREWIDYLSLTERCRTCEGVSHD